ncbi:Formylglycine-generating sulfatase enzyme [Pseudoruegeria aquimaris]|uniref:Formylglycine-generating sulfatase enzyme n=1 Tax=Pseudoruegeria aquimaris TaxID=393663 RepID=A0A1Y5RPH4_9RHOB|nr:SUMF1/EgtB/PvdO family nonheme iron enzyme [Pseudoruegeria aquimaris]SLN22032.1 Formylglycine-generating sulfatase enzyme [Pseudoruegeria aquimaris]
MGAGAKTLLVCGIGGAALAVTAALIATKGGTDLFRAPDLSLVPQMAEAPVPLPDGRAIHVQKFEVTIAEWARCHAAGACSLAVKPRPGFDPETTPATGLSYVDVGEYLAWINGETGLNFRLPTMAEWEAMAAPVLPEKPDPIFTDPSLSWASSYLTENVPARALKPSGSFAVTAEGVADLDGSVWEWTQDCYNDSDPSRCAAFYVGGEHVAAIPLLVRDPARGGCAVGAPPAHLGMRLVSDDPVPTS